MDIKELRDRIDTIDNEMLRLFKERLTVAEEIGKYKAAHGLPINDPAREKEILARHTENSGELELYIYQYFEHLFRLSKARQRELTAEKTPLRTRIEKALEQGNDFFPKTGTVACQGIEGANSQTAAEKLIPRGNITYVKNFDAVFDAVDSGLCTYGILPIENSANGSVRAVYELLQKRDFSIIGSTKLHIRHELLAKHGIKQSEIRTIYSHEQAIGQCSSFLASLGDQVTVIPCGNTAIAAKKVAESDDPYAAAISSHSCASLYDLAVVNDNIRNSDNNYTRFICITKEPRIYAGANRVSLTVGCSNRPGALYEILSHLSVMGINMSKLESCPVVGSDFEFSFFLDFDASVKEPGVISMLEELERTCENISFLGNYTEM